MTKVEIFNHDGRIHGFSVSGHSGYAEEGSDIVCAAVSAAVTFDQVLAVVDGADSKFGTPTVAGAKVEAKVLKNGKGKKIRVFKYRSKKDSKSLQGHRQPYTKVQIEKIAL